MKTFITIIAAALFLSSCSSDKDNVRDNLDDGTLAGAVAFSWNAPSLELYHNGTKLVTENYNQYVRFDRVSDNVVEMYLSLRSSTIDNIHVDVERVNLSGTPSRVNMSQKTEGLVNVGGSQNYEETEISVSGYIMNNYYQNHNTNLTCDCDLEIEFTFGDENNESEEDEPTEGIYHHYVIKVTKLKLN